MSQGRPGESMARYPVHPRLSHQTTGSGYSLYIIYSWMMPDVHCLIGNSRKILENHRYGPIPNWKPLHSLCLEPLPVAPYQLQGLRQSRGGFRRARLCRSDDNCRNRRCYRGQSSIPNLSQFPTILPPSWKKDRKVFFTSKAPRVTGIPQAVQRCPKDF